MKKKIEELQNSMKEQCYKINAQYLNIQVLNKYIINQNTIIDDKEESIKDLKKDLYSNNKDLKLTKICH